MTQTPKLTLAVFFTHGVSLELWEKRGLFSREVKFYEELAREVGEVWLFTYGRDDARFASRLNAHIRIFPKRLPFPDLLYGFLLPLLFWQKLSRVNAIRIHQLAGAIPALLAHWFLHKPLIVRAGFQWYRFTQHQGASRLKLWFISILETCAYRSARAIIHTTQHDADFVAKRYHVPHFKLSVIPNWVDTELFKPMAVEKQSRTVCFVGRLEREKNLPALIEAMQGLDARLILYGEGSQREELEVRARELGVHAEFCGRIANENLSAALSTCTIFVLPSLYEGNPKVLLEAMACGLPVVGTDVEGITSIVTHEQTGLICQVNPESIRQTIDRLLTDPTLRARLGEAAHSAILQSSSLEKAVRKERALYTFL